MNVWRCDEFGYGCDKTAEPGSHGWIIVIEAATKKERHYCGWKHLAKSAYCLESSDNCK